MDEDYSYKGGENFRVSWGLGGNILERTFYLSTPRVERFKIASGVRQGYIMSQLLFDMFGCNGDEITWLRMTGQRKTRKSM